MSSTQLLSRPEIRANYFEQLEIQTQATWLDGMTEYQGGVNSAEGQYPMTSNVPKMEEAIGPFNPPALTSNVMIIRNKVYRNGLRIPKWDLRRDRTGQLSKRTGEFSQTGLTHWMELASELLNNGEAAICSTGFPFFYEAHNDGGADYSNLIDKDDVPELAVVSAGAPTAYEFAMAINAIIPLFFAFRDEQGRSRNRLARKFLVMVPISLMAVASQAITSPTLAVAGGGNINNPLINTMFSIEFDINPDLDWETDFTVSRMDGIQKPIIRQEEQELSVEVFGPESEYYRLNDEALIKVDTSRNVGFGIPWQTIKAQLSNKP
ncbi:MAG: Mu-like prophage major head subunit gpT family protein [Planctomycetota bacterium]